MLKSFVKLGKSAICSLIVTSVPSWAAAEQNVSTLLIYTDDKPLKEFINDIEDIIGFYVERSAASDQFDRGVFASLEQVIVEQEIKTDLLYFLPDVTRKFLDGESGKADGCYIHTGDDTEDSPYILAISEASRGASFSRMCYLSMRAISLGAEFDDLDIASETRLLSNLFATLQ